MTVRSGCGTRQVGRYRAVVLHLLVDTSVWLDLAKKRDGQKLIHALGQIVMNGDAELLVPSVVVDEFERNRDRIEQSMTTSVADRFKALKNDLRNVSAEWHRPDLPGGLIVFDCHQRTSHGFDSSAGAPHQPCCWP